VRQGLRQVLEAAEDLSVAGEAKDGHDAVALAARVAWDVAVVDYNMPGKGGVELVKELRRRFPERAVLVLSMYPEDRYALRLLRAGAAGYLNKESAPEELIGALRKVAAGGRYVSAALGEKLALAVSGGDEAPLYEKLSDREYQIMWLIASGKTVGDIARQLFLSPNTVSTYRTRILKKINVRNNAELMRYAIRHQLVD
jgi:DNA-binding NarL/FixJ family response regulator